jgi:hypothetical protein
MAFAGVLLVDFEAVLVWVLSHSIPLFAFSKILTAKTNPKEFSDQIAGFEEYRATTFKAFISDLCRAFATAALGIEC